MSSPCICCYLNRADQSRTDRLCKVCGNWADHFEHLTLHGRTRRAKAEGVSVRELRSRAEPAGAGR